SLSGPMRAVALIPQTALAAPARPSHPKKPETPGTGDLNLPVTFGGVTFFQLLETHSTNPISHLPKLALMYLCLALGFEGIYRSHR
ncbi:DotU family type IV/VI secretion system protein, partial [Pseudomonas syringae pv. tagetis]|uniref:DotU family type IV/VI secretion system protein n=1 Tax=Pseudomonas syringae group genomosp. 7 TaxID=251699 RepID=UPI00376F5FEA